MPQTFHVDQAATFSAVVLLSCEPRLAFGTQDQEKTKDGTPRWDLQVVGGFRDGFGRTSNEVLKIGVASERNPAETVPQFAPVQLIRFEVGVMDRRDREGNVTGAQVWYRCEGIRPIGAIPNGRKSEPAHAG
jgi:hypothetical protein